jgi:uncharacterized damage-inducible protein DinB
MRIDDVETFLAYFENVRARTERVLDSVPPDSLEWRPADGAFSFGDLIRHIAATERWMFAENAAGRPSRYPGHGPDLASGWDDTRGYLRRMHVDAVAIFSSLDATSLAARCTTPGGIQLPVWKWLRSMVEHEVHHRGQLYLMLRMLGIDSPPLYGLTSEEVRARSLPNT